jgi:hypothetical protein
MHIDSIEKLHQYHQQKEFRPVASLAENHARVTQMVGVLEVIDLTSTVRQYIAEHEEIRNHGVHEVLRCQHVICLLHNHDFRAASAPIALQNKRGEDYFP